MHRQKHQFFGWYMLNLIRKPFELTIVNTTHIGAFPVRSLRSGLNTAFIEHVVKHDEYRVRVFERVVRVTGDLSIGFKRIGIASGIAIQFVIDRYVEPWYTDLADEAVVARKQ